MGKVTSNAKAGIRGTHRGVAEKHPQAHLAEVASRFNRRERMEGLFLRPVKACVFTGTPTYDHLTKTAWLHEKSP